MNELFNQDWQKNLLGNQLEQFGYKATPEELNYMSSGSFQNPYSDLWSLFSTTGENQGHILNPTQAAEAAGINRNSPAYLTLGGKQYANPSAGTPFNAEIREGAGGWLVKPSGKATDIYGNPVTTWSDQAPEWIPDWDARMKEAADPGAIGMIGPLVLGGIAGGVLGPAFGLGDPLAGVSDWLNNLVTAPTTAAPTAASTLPEVAASGMEMAPAAAEGATAAAETAAETYFNPVTGTYMPYGTVGSTPMETSMLDKLVSMGSEAMSSPTNMLKLGGSLLNMFAAGDQMDMLKDQAARANALASRSAGDYEFYNNLLKKSYSPGFDPSKSISGYDTLRRIAEQDMSRKAAAKGLRGNPTYLQNAMNDWAAQQIQKYQAGLADMAKGAGSSAYQMQAGLNSLFPAIGAARTQQWGSIPYALANIFDKWERS